MRRSAAWSMVLGICWIFCRPSDLHAEQPLDIPEPLIGPDGEVSQSVLETFLSPAEFSDRRFQYISKGDEALFAVDASLSAKKPLIELHPERISWPAIADLTLKIEGKPPSLTPTSGLTDEALDRGFEIVWTIEALGQRFSPSPSFAARITAASIVSTSERKSIASWQAPERQPACRVTGKQDTARCRMTIGFEVRAMSLSPEGSLLSLAFCGLRPRIEIYDIHRSPRLLWQALFPKESGGVVETAFSSDGEWVTALTGKGVMHRFASGSGGKHLAVQSSGRTALAIPPGRMMAVAGDGGEITLWYLADGTVARKFPARDNRGTVDRLAASGNGEIIATLEYTDTQSIIRVWAVKNRALLRQLEVQGRSVSAIALNEFGTTVFASHETFGLLSAAVAKKASLNPVSGNAGKHCTGRIEWVPKQSMLVCSVKDGLLQIDDHGEPKQTLKIDEAAADWVTAASADRIAAAGGGRLLIWWTD